MGMSVAETHASSQVVDSADQTNETTSQARDSAAAKKDAIQQPKVSLNNLRGGTSAQTNNGTQTNVNDRMASNQNNDVTSTTEKVVTNQNKNSKQGITQTTKKISKVGNNQEEKQDTELNFIDNEGNEQSSVTVKTHESLTFQFKTNDYVAGDKFTFKGHPADGQDGIDITGCYQITPANDKSQHVTVSSVQSNSNEYDWTDTMKDAGTYRQIISLEIRNPFKPGKLYKDCTYKINIDLYRNGKYLK